MDELRDLKGDALLQHPRVVAAYWKLMGKNQFSHSWVGPWRNPDSGKEFYACSKCDARLTDRVRTSVSICEMPDLIPGPIEKVAFLLRNACIAKDLPWYAMMRYIASGQWPFDYDDWIMDYSQADDWIKAAVLAYEVQEVKP